MSFFSPNMLWLLMILPVLVAGYILMLRRQNKRSVRYAHIGLVKAAVGPGQRMRRHVPPALFLVALGVALFSISRPAAVITLPSQRETIILAMDVSGSMRATDMEPQRISAAQSAAIEFVKELPISARIGVVAFSSNAMTVQRPTDNIDDIVAAISRLAPQRYTAMGSGILTALKDIFQEGDDLGDGTPLHDGTRGAPLGEAAPVEEETKIVAPGSYTSAIIILLTDGQTNMGIDPIRAAKDAAKKGVRIYTVGFGSEKGGTIQFEGHRTHVKLDEFTLRKVAEITRGEYFRAGSRQELKTIYTNLTKQLVMEEKKTEMTGIFAGLAALLVILAGALSMKWTNRFV
jgi:Ca-activated chloride channel family protein